MHGLVIRLQAADLPPRRHVPKDNAFPIRRGEQAAVTREVERVESSAVNSRVRPVLLQLGDFLAGTHVPQGRPLYQRAAGQRLAVGGEGERIDRPALDKMEALSRVRFP